MSLGTLAVGVGLTGALVGQELRLLGGSGDFAATADPGRGRVLTIGVRGETREWDGQHWRLRPVDRIRWRNGWLELAFDPTRAAPLLVGPDSTFQFRTRIFDGVAWHLLQPQASPPMRGQFALVTDEAAAEVLLFGGTDGSTVFGDTWTFDGSTWTARQPVGSPSPRVQPAACYDAANGRVLLFSGWSDGSGFGVGGTWNWAAGNWSPIPTSTSPPPRGGAAMAFDAARDRAVLFSGFSWTGWDDEVWEFDGVDWQMIPTSGPGPDRRQNSRLVFDPVRGECLLIGGRSATTGRYEADVWSWDGTSWHSVHDAPRNPSLLRATASPGGDAVVGIHWDGSFIGRTWVFADDAWSMVPGITPARRSLDFSMTTGPRYSYLYGGSLHTSTSQQDFADLWGFDGTSWSLLAAQGPSAGRGVEVVYDWSRSELLLFGGGWGQPGDETRVFDGASWLQRQPGGSPSPRFDTRMAFDAARSRVVLFGGRTGSFVLLTDTWEWDGSAWSQVATASGPPPREQRWMSYDEQRQRVVHVASDSVGIHVWTFDGADWSEVALPQIFTNTVVGMTPIGWPYPHGTMLLDSDLFALRQPGIEPYGSACGAGAPEIAANEWARVGSATFGVDVVRAPASSVAVLLAATLGANLSLAGCRLLVDPLQTCVLLPTSATGFATAALPLPNDPGLAGVDLRIQAAAADGSAASGFTLSRGLRVRIDF